jgi:hypothetical protein
MRWQTTERCSVGVLLCTTSRQVFLCIILAPDDEAKNQDVEETKSEDNEEDNTPIAASIVTTGLPSHRLSSF